MPRQPRSHELEELSRIQLRNLFSQLGWVVWDLNPDYGEDLLVRIFTNEMATHYSFFVQAKATDHIDRYMDKEEKYLSFPIDVDHLEHWEQFWEPVILTVWDAVSDITYWVIIQDYLETNDVDLSRQRIYVRIPRTNVLDDNGLERVLKLTRSRFQRFELTCEGVYALVNLLEKNLNVSVVYEPGENRMGVFYGSKDPSEWKGLDYILLDGLPEMAVEGTGKEGITSQQFLERYFDKCLKGTFNKSLSNNLEYSVKVMGEVISLRWRLWEK